MTNLLVRDVPDDVIAALDTRAAQLGLSRSEYLRRRLAQEAQLTQQVTVADLKHLAELLVDLDDPEVMRGAWE